MTLDSRLDELAKQNPRCDCGLFYNEEEGCVACSKSVTKSTESEAAAARMRIDADRRKRREGLPSPATVDSEQSRQQAYAYREAYEAGEYDRARAMYERFRKVTKAPYVESHGPIMVGCQTCGGQEEMRNTREARQWAKEHAKEKCSMCDLGKAKSRLAKEAPDPASFPKCASCGTNAFTMDRDHAKIGPSWVCGRCHKVWAKAKEEQDECATCGKSWRKSYGERLEYLEKAIGEPDDPRTPQERPTLTGVAGRVALGFVAGYLAAKALKTLQTRGPSAQQINDAQVRQAVDQAWEQLKAMRMKGSYEERLDFLEKDWADMQQWYRAGRSGNILQPIARHIEGRVQARQQAEAAAKKRAEQEADPVYQHEQWKEQQVQAKRLAEAKKWQTQQQTEAAQRHADEAPQREAARQADITQTRQQLGDLLGTPKQYKPPQPPQATPQAPKPKKFSPTPDQMPRKPPQQKASLLSGSVEDRLQRLCDQVHECGEKEDVEKANILAPVWPSALGRLVPDPIRQALGLNEPQPLPGAAVGARTAQTLARGARQLGEGGKKVLGQLGEQQRATRLGVGATAGLAGSQLQHTVPKPPAPPKSTWSREPGKNVPQTEAAKPQPPKPPQQQRQWERPKVTNVPQAPAPPPAPQAPKQEQAQATTPAQEVAPKVETQQTPVEEQTPAQEQKPAQAPRQETGQPEPAKPDEPKQQAPTQQKPPKKDEPEPKKKRDLPRPPIPGEGGERGPPREAPVDPSVARPSETKQVCDSKGNCRTVSVRSPIPEGFAVRSEKKSAEMHTLECTLNWLSTHG